MNESMHDEPATAMQPPGAPANGGRRKVIGAILAVFAGVGIAYGVYWALVARYTVATDDAYVGGNVVQITPQVPGTVVAIDVDDTDFVRTGQELVELDRADADVALRHAKAQLGRTVRNVRHLYANAAQLKATLALREVQLAKARDDLARREKLASSGAISAEEVQHARDAMRVADSAVAAAREELGGNQALTDGTTLASHPDVARDAAQVRAAWLDYQRTSLPAPVSGFIAKRSVQLGQRVAPGTPLMAVVPLEDVWVDANFKENQLRHIRVGQRATLIADANGFEYHGKVAGFGAGTGAAFALLPAQNATGNWIKVVQRLPVRITLDAKELDAHPLQIGLSMEVEVDVRRQDGAQLAEAPRADPAYRTTVFAAQGQSVECLIADIIARNAGSPMPVCHGAPHEHKPASRPGRTDLAQSVTHTDDARR